MAHKTARGASIDIAALAKKHETQKAIGNANMNARGDRLGADGNVVATVQRITTEQRNNPTIEETTTMSAAQTPSKRKIKLKETAPGIINKIEKNREDGTSFYEIEYDDGSIVIEEINKDKQDGHSTSNKK
jgi:hypothetical protein